MRGRKLSYEIVLGAVEREHLERLQRTTTLPVGLHRRVQAILLLDDRQTATDTAKRCGLGVRIVRKWARRYLADGLEGLKDKPGRGRKPAFSP